MPALLPDPPPATVRTGQPSWLTREKLLRAAGRAGGVALADVADDANGVLVARVVYQDPWAAARFLVEVAKEDTGDPVVWRIATALRAKARDEAEFQALVQAWVQKNIRFAKEPVETFQSPRYTIETRVGDCDCHARLVYALLIAGGSEGRFAFLSDADGNPRHTWVQGHVARVWVDLETTIAAHFGETPMVAAKRMGLRTRADLSGERTVTMSGVAPAGETVQGVDLAKWAGVVDFAALAKSYAFAIVRTSDGMGADPRFAANYAGAKAAGMVRGSYQFFRASQDPVAQADLVSKAVGSLGLYDLPPACDLELADGMDLGAIPDRVLAWGARIKSNLGVTPILYTMPGFYEPLPASALDGAWPLWIAHWGVQAPTLPRGWTSWDFWQYKGTTEVAGAGSVDLNVFNGGALALKWYAAKKASAPVVGGSSDGGSSPPPDLPSGSGPLPTNGSGGGCGNGGG